uniref:6-pyruvoyltetrahydropterin synthase n=1 Tax=Soboliphyme baturini TaxID=241478 RepID=A0A183J308_9BILA
LLLYFSDHLSAEENKLIFGKCNNSNGHGHNYEVQATVKAPVDPLTGMAMNLSELKTHLCSLLQDCHQVCNREKLYFVTGLFCSTTENVAVYIWSQLSDVLGKKNALFEVVVHETDKNSVTYRGEVMLE